MKWLFRQVATILSWLLPSSESSKAQFLKLIAYDYVRRWLFDHPDVARDVRSVYRIVEAFALEFGISDAASMRIVKSTLFDMGIHPKIEPMKLDN